MEDQKYFEYYTDLRLHAEMMRDGVRVNAYQAAIERAGMRGKVCNVYISF